jgi:DNA-binding NarL/FixJ family response regulator
MPVRVVLGDDHTLIRQALRDLLEKRGFVVVGEAGDGQDVVRQVETNLPEVLILDVGMPVLNGIEAAREVTRRFPKTRVILLTQHDEEQYVREALDAGVQGYVLKSQLAGDLIHAIEQASKGQVYLSPGVSRAVVQAFQTRGSRPKSVLTTRERQVLQLIAEGKSTRDVAALLGVSQKTAETHRTRLMQKLDIHETASLVRYAIREGLTQP